MRRESSPHGPGTKLILNQLLVPGEVTPEKHAEKALRLTCIDVETGRPTSFLFKVRMRQQPFDAALDHCSLYCGMDGCGVLHQFKTNAESDEMLKLLHAQLESQNQEKGPEAEVKTDGP